MVANVFREGVTAPSAATKVSDAAKLLAAGTSAMAAKRLLGIAGAGALTIDDACTTGCTAGAYSRGGDSLVMLVAAAASKPVVRAVVIFIAACAIASFLPE